MEIKTEIIEPEKKLGKEEKNKLAKQISSNFAQWDDDRSEQISIAREIMEETYLRQPKKKLDKRLEWKSDIKLNQLYNIKRARKSQIWREMWSQPSQMFEVQGTDEKTEQDARIQKASIVDSLNKMEIGKAYDEATDNLYDIGEMIFKVDWVKKKKLVKRRKKGVGFALMNIVRNMTGAGYMQQEFQDVEIPVYENARVQSVSPFMFVFDHSKYKVRDLESWDSCLKIYKRFDTLENIKANKVYEITKEQIQELENDLKEKAENKSEDNKELVDLRDEDKIGNQFEILFAHGDFKINGKIFKNYVAEVLAGKFLIRFEENPINVNPFILCALEYDPYTKRGISPLKSCKGMAKCEEDLTNCALDVQKLIANPPCWIDEALIDENNTDKDGNIYYAPGKYLKHKSEYSGGLPTPAKFSGDGINNLITYVEQKIADLSSVSNVNFGNIENQKRTATELSLADKGSSAQISKELDIINQDLTIPMIEKVAELKAMFADGVEFVYAEEKGKKIEYEITNEIRQAQYNYIYEDRNAINDRKSKFEQLYQLFQGLAQVPELQGRLNWQEIATQGIEMIGFDNTEKFFNENDQLAQMAQEFKQLPEEVQQYLLPLFAQATQQTMKQYQIQQQQAQMKTQAQNQVQMDIFRQQARNEAEQQMMGDMGVV